MAVKRGLKHYSKKFWHLLWKDYSFKGWLFSVIFLFILIKFIFFPVHGFLTGTSLPLAIVESCSMYHEDNLFSDFEEWWDKHETKYSQFTINELDFQEFPLKNGFNKGDILFITRASPEKLEEGDIVIFNANQRNPVIHRIIDIKEGGNERIFSTIGDNNNRQLVFEKEISSEQLIGITKLKIIPYAGWIKLVFYDWQKPESERGFCNER